MEKIIVCSYLFSKNYQNKITCQISLLWEKLEEQIPTWSSIQIFYSTITAVELELNLNTLPHVVYILKTKSTSVKILKQ